MAGLQQIPRGRSAALEPTSLRRPNPPNRGAHAPPGGRALSIPWRNPMASKAKHASLWLPGFEIDAPAYPDLFSSNDKAAAPASDLSADSGESATADTAGDLPRPWRPAAAQATQPTDGRSPTPDERIALLRFTGCGGIPASFNFDGTDAAWKQRARQLSELLQPSEYESARASVNNSHYTEPFMSAGSGRHFAARGSRVDESWTPAAASVTSWAACRPTSPREAA
jgi:hypothetical protein